MLDNEKDRSLNWTSILSFDAGTMQTLDARHIELFLSEEYHSGIWDYYLLGSHNINKQADGASGGIFDLKHINDESTSGIYHIKSNPFYLHQLSNTTLCLPLQSSLCYHVSFWINFFRYLWLQNMGGKTNWLATKNKDNSSRGSSKH